MICADSGFFVVNLFYFYGVRLLVAGIDGA